MARPVVSDATEELYSALEPAWTVQDEALDWPLLKFCSALCTMIDSIWEIVQPYEGPYTAPNPTKPGEGWAHVFNPHSSPEFALDWLAQFVGVTVQPGWTVAEKRAAIATPEGWARGTRAALISAIERTLTGDKHIAFVERQGGNAYQLSVRTQESETPDEDVTRAAILEQKPAGLVLDYDAITGATYAEVEAAYADYAAVDAGNDDYAELLLLPV